MLVIFLAKIYETGRIQEFSMTKDVLHQCKDELPWTHILVQSCSKYVGVVWLFFLIKPLCVINVWSNKDPKYEHLKHIHVYNSLDYIFIFMK